MKLNYILVGLALIVGTSTLACSRRHTKNGQPLTRAYSHIEQSVARNVDGTTNRRIETFRVLK